MIAGARWIAITAALHMLAGCAALTSKQEFRSYESVALEPDAVRRYERAEAYLRTFEEPAYGVEVSQFAEQARPVVEQLRAARAEAERQAREEAIALQQRAEAERLAEVERQRRARDEAEAVERNQRATATFELVRGVVDERIGAHDWDGAARAIDTWLAEFRGTTHQPDAETLAAEVERGRQLSLGIASTGAVRLARPARLYVALEGVVPRTIANPTAPPRGDLQAFARGERVDAWYRSPDGWVLVASPERAGPAGRLTRMLGWVRRDEVAARDLLAEELAERERVAREQADAAARETAEAARLENECRAAAAAWGRVRSARLVATTPPTVLLPGSEFAGEEGIARAAAIARALARHALCTNPSFTTVRVMTGGGAIVGTVGR